MSPHFDCFLVDRKCRLNRNRRNREGILSFADGASGQFSLPANVVLLLVAGHKPTGVNVLLPLAVTLKPDMAVCGKLIRLPLGNCCLRCPAADFLGGGSVGRCVGLVGQAQFAGLFAYGAVDLVVQ